MLINNLWFDYVIRDSENESQTFTITNIWNCKLIGCASCERSRFPSTRPNWSTDCHNGNILAKGKLFYSLSLVFQPWHMYLLMQSVNVIINSSHKHKCHSDNFHLLFIVANWPWFDEPRQRDQQFLASLTPPSTMNYEGLFKINIGLTGTNRHIFI